MVIHTQKEINNMPIKPKQRDLRDKNVTEPKDFGSAHEISDRLIKQLFTSELVASIL